MLHRRANASLCKEAAHKEKETYRDIKRVGERERKECESRCRVGRVNEELLIRSGLA